MSSQHISQQFEIPLKTTEKIKNMQQNNTRFSEQVKNNTDDRQRFEIPEDLKPK